MHRMRHTITALAFCLFMVLSGAGLLAAAALQDDEKITMPKAPSALPVPGRVLPPEGTRGPGDAPVPSQVIPDRSGTVIIVPSPPRSDETIVLSPPEQSGVVPHPSGTSPSDQASPAEIPAVPVLPDKTIPLEIPVIPVLPQVPDRTTVLTPSHQQETPQKEAIAPYSASPTPEPPAVLEPGKQPSPMDFLPMPTLLAPEKTPREPKAEKDKPPDKMRPEEPKKQTPLKAEQTKPKPGDPLRIPPDAAKTGDLSFLEGCWRATYPEGRTKRTLHERLCFDKNGDGKRTLEDPKYGVTCTSASKGKVDAQGRLTVANERGPCSAGGHTGATYMVCKGEGNATPCFWRFPDLGGTTQNYKIPLLRE